MRKSEGMTGILQYAVELLRRQSWVDNVHYKHPYLVKRALQPRTNIRMRFGSYPELVRIEQLEL